MAAFTARLQERFQQADLVPFDLRPDASETFNRIRGPSLSDVEADLCRWRLVFPTTRVRRASDFGLNRRFGIVGSLTAGNRAIIR